MHQPLPKVKVTRVSEEMIVGGPFIAKQGSSSCPKWSKHEWRVYYKGEEVRKHLKNSHEVIRWIKLNTEEYPPLDGPLEIIDPEELPY